MSADGDLYGEGVEEEKIRRERAKAREIRKSRWWQTKLSLGVCYYCGNKTPARDLTMDHIVPLARGGESSKGNLAACCKECNNLKRTMLPMEWDAYMERLEGKGER